MTAFMFRFLMCNLIISIIIGIFMAVKWFFRKNLTCRMQYNLWFLLLGLLVVPFLPFRLVCFAKTFLWFETFKLKPLQNIGTVMNEATAYHTSGAVNWMQNFTLSTTQENFSGIWEVLFYIWIAGIFVMFVFVVKSALHFNTIKKSALPLQNKEVSKLYQYCLYEMDIAKQLPIYSTAFLKSPVIEGFIKPCIYLPIHLISDYDASDMRYMLLHELQHYKHKDALANHLMNLAGVFYWFHPLVWFALKEMRNDREVACDASVLNMLNEDDYEDYGNTLINMAEKISLFPFPFSTGISGTMKQMKRRILNIVSYENPSIQKRLKSSSLFGLIALLLLKLAPVLSTYAVEENHYEWNTSSKNISYIDLSAYFDTFEASFALYDLKNDAWQIYDKEHATLRVSPDSTYKIYSALFGLEEDVITPEYSFITWDKENYPFKEWNRNQTLNSAMDASVNWYFYAIEEQLGSSTVSDYIKKIGYGNQNMSGDFSSYWMESSLKISTIEQVELLTQFYNNSFGFTPKNIHTVKDAICLSSSEKGNLYGKTGSGRVNEKDVNGWFVGYVERTENTYFFAVNITATEHATGSKASKIALSILSDMNIYSG